MPGRFLSELRDAVFPPRCRVCGELAPDGRTCAAHVLPNGPGAPRCGRCAAALPPALPDGTACRACRARAPGFRGVVALGDYRDDPGLADWVLRLKHGGRRDLAGPLARGMAALLDADRRGARWRRVLVPVPAHGLRRLERGYDQALLLARAVAEEARLPLVRALLRRRPTAPQGAAGARTRRANVRGAFALRRPAVRLDGADAWLVDDVMTSGATAEECAALLRAAGARAVYVVCAARAGPSGREGESGSRPHATP